MYEQEKGKILSAMWDVPAGAFVAGGALTSVFTNQPINDVDVYFKTKEDFVRAITNAYDEGLWCVALSKRAVTFARGNDIAQYMFFNFFPTPEDIFQSFDFTINMGTLDLDSKEFTLHEDFLKHNSQRFLRFNSGTRYPIASALRVLKYKERGYTIGKGEFLKVILAARIPEINSWDDLKDQIGGSYGEAVALENEAAEFSAVAAVNAINAERVWVKDKQTDIPGSAEDLLDRIGFGSEYDSLMKAA